MMIQFSNEDAVEFIKNYRQKTEEIESQREELGSMIDSLCETDFLGETSKSFNQAYHQWEAVLIGFEIACQALLDVNETQYAEGLNNREQADRINITAYY